MTTRTIAATEPEIVATAPDPRIAELDVPQLQVLRDRIDERIRQLRETGHAELLARFEAEAARLGFSVKDFCAAAARRKPRRGRPKLTHAED